MMRTAFMLFLFAIAFPAEASWNSLWLNPDQRGEALLQQGDASAAAREYKDPRRRAYAEMKAGDFKQAASDLGNLHDSDSYYNRGNALAKMGDLKGALDAYDAALKSDPNNQDARHNRDLVENALKQKPPQQNSGTNQQQSGQQQDSKSGGKQDNKQGSNSGGKGKQGSQSGNGANGANNNSGQQSQSAEKNSSQSGKSGGNPAGGNSAAQQNAQAGASGNKAQQNPQKNPGQQGSDANSAAQPGQGQSGESAVGRQQSGNSESHTGQQSSPMKPGLSPDEAAQARQDAAASLGYAGKDKQQTNGTGDADTTAAPVDQTAPLSEQQLSKEQWLRSIPDDPGGLLRRKFMIEYMLRQQKAQQ